MVATAIHISLVQQHATTTTNAFIATTTTANINASSEGFLCAVVSPVRPRLLLRLCRVAMKSPLAATCNNNNKCFIATITTANINASSDGFLWLLVLCLSSVPPRLLLRLCRVVMKTSPASSVVISVLSSKPLLWISFHFLLCYLNLYLF